MQQQTNTNMISDRNVLTDKELHYIKDYLSWELLAMKKCHHSAQLCQDPQIKIQINEIGKTHMNNYNTLLNHLQ